MDPRPAASPAGEREDGREMAKRKSFTLPYRLWKSFSAWNTARRYHESASARLLIVADSAGFHLRRMVSSTHDGIRDETLYTADKPLGTAKTIGELPALIQAALIDCAAYNEN
jgi:hypothetical protein